MSLPRDRLPLFTMSNRIVQGLGLATPDPQGMREAVERLYSQGYAGTLQYILEGKGKTT
jgi:hypothetical protein